MHKFLLFVLLFLQPVHAQVDITKGANGSLIARPKGENAVILQANKQPQECVYNSGSSTTASDTTTFRTGCEGTNILSFTGTASTFLVRRVQFSSDLAEDEYAVLQVKRDSTSAWLSFFGNISVSMITGQDGVNPMAGLGMEAVSGSKKQFDVQFGLGGRIWNPTGVGGTWSQVANYKWRVARFKLPNN